jgi:hypothetical protein
MRFLTNLILLLAVTALIGLAALSGVWMKKPEKKDPRPPSVTVVIPRDQVAEPPPPERAPPAQKYRL